MAHCLGGNTLWSKLSDMVLFLHGFEVQNWAFSISSEKKKIQYKSEINKKLINIEKD